MKIVKFLHDLLRSIRAKGKGAGKGGLITNVKFYELKRI